MQEILDEPEVTEIEKTISIFSKIIALAIIHSFFTLVIVHCFVNEIPPSQIHNFLNNFTIYNILENWFIAYLFMSFNFTKDYDLSRSTLISLPVFLFGIFANMFLYLLLSFILGMDNMNAVLDLIKSLILVVIEDWQFTLRYFILGLLSVTGMYFLKHKAYLKTLLALISSILIFLIPLAGFCWECL